jgi:transcriptional regulator with XRE-family HTH domain
MGIKSASYRLRKRLGLTQDKFAKITKKSVRTIVRWEAANNMPMKDIITVCNLFGLDPGEFSEDLKSERRCKVLIKKTAERFPLLKFREVFLNFDLCGGLISLLPLNEKYTAPFIENITKYNQHFHLDNKYTIDELLNLISENLFLFDRAYRCSELDYQDGIFSLRLSQGAKKAILRISEKINRANNAIQKRKIITPDNIKEYLEDRIVPPRGIVLKEYVKKILNSEGKYLKFNDDLNTVEKLTRKLMSLQSDEILIEQQKNI